MISRQYLKVCLIISAMFLLSACEQESHQDLVTFVNDAYKDQKPEIEPLPPIVPYEEFIYEASNLPDPFARDNVLAGSEGEEFEEASGLDSNRRKDPLEAFPLDGLRLDGVLEFRGVLSAIIRSPDGDSVPVSVGDYMGQNSGKIISINSESQVLEIEETVRNATGKWVKRIVKVTGDES